MASTPWTILRYDTPRFPLAEVAARMLGVPDLALLEPAERVATRETDQRSDYHARFYGRLELILPLYRRLLAELLGDGLREVYVQRVPTFRVHLRGSVAVGSWHRDSDFGHDPAEVNYWLPLTRAYDSNTVWICGAPVAAEYGDVVVFDGAGLLHGNVVNETPHSRVSFDFRVIPRAAYRPRAERTVSAGVRFIVGEYWDVL
jgi:hypothetical protein